jgi:predicted secreted protein
VARIHGRNGIIYVNLASGGTAEPVAYLNSWSIKMATDTAEVTAFGDTNKTYIAGLPDCSGDFGGYYDDASVQTYTAASDGIARKMYLYPSTLKTTQYFYGSTIVDFSADAKVDGAVTISASWKAAGNIVKVG